MKRWVLSLVIASGLWLAIGVHSEETVDRAVETDEATTESDVVVRRIGGRKRVMPTSNGEWPKIEFPGDHELQSIFERVLNPFVSNEEEVEEKVESEAPERNLIDEFAALLEFVVHALPDLERDEPAPAAADAEQAIASVEESGNQEEPAEVVVIDLGETGVERKRPGFGLLARLFEPETESVGDANSEETLSITIERIPDDLVDESNSETAPEESLASVATIEVVPRPIDEFAEAPDQEQETLLGRLIGNRFNQAREAEGSGIRAAAGTGEAGLSRIVGRFRIGRRDQAEPTSIPTDSDAELIDDDSDLELTEIIVEIGPERHESSIPLMVGGQAGEPTGLIGSGFEAGAGAKSKRPADVYIAGIGDSQPIRQFIPSSDRGSSLTVSGSNQSSIPTQVAPTQTVTVPPSPPKPASPPLVAEMNGPGPSWPFRSRKREEDQTPAETRPAAAEFSKPEAKPEKSNVSDEPKRSRFRIRIANRDKETKEPEEAQKSEQRALVAELRVREPDPPEPKARPKKDQKPKTERNRGSLFGGKAKSSGSESNTRSERPNEPLAEGYVYAKTRSRFYQLSNRSRKSDQGSPVEIRRGTVLKLRNPGDHYLQVQTASGLVGIAPAEAFRTATKREAEVFDLAAAKVAADEAKPKPTPAAAESGHSLQDISEEDLPLGMGLLTPTE